MVMKVMRAGTKPILWIVVAAFVGTIIFAWGMEFTSKQAARGIIGEVNGAEIKFDDYNYMYQTAWSQEQDRTGDVSEETAARLRDDVFDQLVGELLLREVTKRIGLAVTDRELAEHLRRFPPQEIRNFEPFLTNGQFDYSKYLQAYQNPDPRLWLQLEALVRPRLARSKLYEYVTATTVVNDADVRELYETATEKVRVRYLLATVQTYQDSVGPIDTAAAREYYTAHTERFRHGERAQINYLTFEKKPSAVDSLEVRRDAEDVARRARSGEDFATLARQYSEDVAAGDGDLGWFGRGAMVPQFEEAAFAMDSGQVSDPVETRFGYHVIKVLGKRGAGDSAEVHAAHILLRMRASGGTLSDLRLEAEQFADDARRDGLDSAAVRRGKILRSSGWFERGQDIAGIGSEPAIAEFAFNSKPGSISGAFEMPTYFVVVYLRQREPAGVTPFAEVQSGLMSRLRTDAARAKAAERLEEIRPQLAAGLSFADAAARYGFVLDSTALFGRLDPVDPFGDDPVFHGAAFALARTAASISPVARVNRGAVILQLIEHRSADPQTYAEKRDSIMTTTLQSKQQMAFNNWYAQLRRNADIRDYRYQLPGEY